MHHKELCSVSRYLYLNNFKKICKPKRLIIHEDLKEDAKNILDFRALDQERKTFHFDCHLKLSKTIRPTVPGKLYCRKFSKKLTTKLTKKNNEKIFNSNIL